MNSVNLGKRPEVDMLWETHFIVTLNSDNIISNTSGLDYHQNKVQNNT